MKSNQYYSNASQLLGMKVTSSDHEKGTIEASFIAKEAFLNFAGNIQGGILVAMLDDLMGYALGITFSPRQFAPTANLNVSFIRPAGLGVINGRGEILKQSGNVYHLSAKLYNSQQELLAAATAKAKLMK